MSSTPTARRSPRGRGEPRLLRFKEDYLRERPAAREAHARHRRARHRRRRRRRYALAAGLGVLALAALLLAALL